jgi:hypothetical protein
MRHFQYLAFMPTDVLISIQLTDSKARPSSSAYGGDDDRLPKVQGNGLGVRSSPSQGLVWSIGLSMRCGRNALPSMLPGGRLERDPKSGAGRICRNQVCDARCGQEGELMADDVYNVTIHDDFSGEILLHEQLTREDAEQALLEFDLVRDHPRMALVRAVLAAGLYSFNGRSVFVRRVPAPVGD